MSISGKKEQFVLVKIEDGVPVAWNGVSAGQHAMYQTVCDRVAKVLQDPFRDAKTLVILINGAGERVVYDFTDTERLMAAITPIKKTKAHDRFIPGYRSLMITYGFSQSYETWSILPVMAYGYL